MAVATGTALAIGGGIIAGSAIAGSMKDHSSQGGSSGMDLAPASALELQGQSSLSQALSQYGDMVNAGPGQNDVTNGLNSQRGLASMFQSYAQGGNQPNANDISQSNDLASKLFGAQRTQMQQGFRDQLSGANEDAALMGRGGNDPMLRAKLAQGQMDQSNVLDAQQGGWAAQNAMSMPGQRLGFLQGAAGIQQGLATQAMANRQALASMGAGIMNDERNFRVATATKWGQSSNESGGGLKGALNGGIAGTGMAMGLMSGMTAGGMGAAPAAPSAASGMGGSNFFSQPNPYGMAGGGLQMPQQSAAPNFNASSYQMGSGMGFGQSRSFKLSGY